VVEPKVVIGVAGGSGSGKTTVVRRIVESLGPEDVIVLDHDRYYRDRNDLRLEERAALNYDHPDALETDLMVQHVRALKLGQPIQVPRYDFTRHARLLETETFNPRRAVIAEGILVFTDPALRQLMDLKCLSTRIQIPASFAAWSATWRSAAARWSRSSNSTKAR
jgi:uridine kinase